MNSEKVTDSKSILAVVFVVLCVVAVVLGAVVAANAMNRGIVAKGVAKEDEPVVREDGVELSTLRERNEEVDALETIYADSGSEVALGMYDDSIKLALEMQDYDLAMDLISSRGVMLQEDGKCQEALKYYDDMDVSSWPAVVRLYYYGGAAGLSEECGDMERLASYEEKQQLMYEKEGIEEYDD